MFIALSHQSTRCQPYHHARLADPYCGIYTSRVKLVLIGKIFEIMESSLNTLMFQISRSFKSSGSILVQRSSTWIWCFSSPNNIMSDLIHYYFTLKNTEWNLREPISTLTVPSYSLNLFYDFPFQLKFLFPLLAKSLHIMERVVKC